jgi:thymidylate synthase (FAD)
MKIVSPSFSIESPIDGEQALQQIERAGRTCYKSEDKITTNSAMKFAQTIMQRGHLSVIEHIAVTVRIVCDRGVSHELVRHRIASYSQESTRYCNYTGGKFGAEISVVRPCFWSEDSAEFAIWKQSMEQAEAAYNALIARGASPQQARSVLPSSLKTEIVATMNLREWRHFFGLRTASAAHSQMREIAIPLLAEFKRHIPIIFDDL